MRDARDFCALLVKRCVYYYNCIGVRVHTTSTGERED